MKRFYTFLILLSLACLTDSCTTYYVAANKTSVDLFADENVTEIAYNVPVGTALLIKGKPRNGTAKVKY